MFRTVVDVKAAVRRQITARPELTRAGRKTVEKKSSPPDPSSRPFTREQNEGALTI